MHSCNFSNSIVVVISNENITIGIDSNACRAIKSSDPYCPLSKCSYPIPRERAHHASRRNHSNAIVVCVSHKYIVIRIDGNACRTTKPSICTSAIYKACGGLIACKCSYNYTCMVWIFTSHKCCLSNAMIINDI